MTLNEALADLAERFTISDEPAATGAVILASGGITDDADNPPLLCLTREMAVGTWLRSLKAHALGGSTLRWAETPGLYRFQVTVSNADTMTHRVVADRFAVVCGVSVS